jgi:hypothetical protein
MIEDFLLARQIQCYRLPDWAKAVIGISATSSTDPSSSQSRSTARNAVTFRGQSLVGFEGMTIVAQKEAASDL